MRDYKHSLPAARNVISFLRDSYGLDVRSLALFRILVALVVLTDLMSRQPHTRQLYSDAGVFPRSLAMDLIHPDRWSILFLSGTPEFAGLVFVTGIVAAMLMAIGWRTRIATVVLWIAVLSIQARNNHANSGADTLLRMSLFWGMFLPLGATWSIDRYLSQLPATTTAAAPRVVVNLVSFGLLLQTACVYFFTALLKDGPGWRADGTAVYYALGIADIANPLGDWLFRTAPAWFFRGATTGTLWIEFAVPLMLIIPTRTGWLRTVAVLLVIVLHLSIAATMWVGLFGAIAIASVVALLPTRFWAFADAHWRMPVAVTVMFHRVRSFLNNLGFALPDRRHPRSQVQPVSEQAMLPIRRNLRPDPDEMSRTALNVVGALSIALLLLWNISTVSSYQPPAPATRLAMASGIFQQWSMFSPNPQGGTLWFVIEGELVSGEKVDVMTAVVAGDVSIRQPVVWDQSEGHVVTDKYWRKYFEAIQTREGDLFAFADTTCQGWNEENVADEKLARITITQGFATTLPTNERADPVFTLIGTWNCG